MSLFAQPLRWEPELLSRYDLAGPRHTSYPTAPRFSEQFAEVDFRNAVSRSNASGSPLSLYFHLPFCDALSFTVVVTRW